MRELDTLGKYHAFFADYVALINRHKRLIEVDVSELAEATSQPLKALDDSSLEGSDARLYGAVFESLLRNIELNNAMSREDVLTQYTISQRISFTFRLLRLLDKTYGRAVRETREHDTKQEEVTK